MSFGADARRARDGSLPLDVRVAALRSCVRFNPVGYRVAFDALRAAIGVTDEPWTDGKIRDGLALLERWRVDWRSIDVRWRSFATERKRSGRPLTSTELEELDRERRAVGPGFPRTRPTYEERQRARPRCDSFPSHLSDDLDVVRSILPAPIATSTNTFDVLLDDWVSIPLRQYHPEPTWDLVRSLNPRQRLMLHCIYTRHDNGYVRQRHLAPLLVATSHWVIPYVVRLVGEYVVEIVHDIDDGLRDIRSTGSWQHDRYRRFTLWNRSFVDLTWQRAASYWACYYRRDYLGPHQPANGGTRSRLARYPAFGILEAMTRR